MNEPIKPRDANPTCFRCKIAASVKVAVIQSEPSEIIWLKVYDIPKENDSLWEDNACMINFNLIIIHIV